MRPTLLRLSAFTSAVVLGLSLSACSGDGEGPSTPPAEQEPTTSDSVTPTPDGGGNLQGEGDDYVFGVDRDQLAEAAEQAFKNKNGVVTWEGDTMVLSLPDGDADTEMAGFTECRVLLDFVKEDETVTIEFPNGRVDCADVVE